MSDQEKKASREGSWFLGLVKWAGGIVATVVGGVLIWYFTTSHGPGPKDTLPPVPRMCDKMPNKGASCSAGLGACAQAGSWVCNQAGDDLVCSATPSRADNSFHNTPAPNGSWDWNCNGQDERQWGACENFPQCPDPTQNITADSPVGFCSEQRKAEGCTPTLAACGSNGWIYPCVRSPDDGRCHAGWFETVVVMACR